MIKKKLLPTLAAVLLIIISIYVPASAADVYAEDITAVPGKTVAIPIYIKDNDGLMGFRITVTYDDEILKNPTATGAGLTTAGLFNSSIGQSSSGSFDVVWCSDSEVKKDGEIMVLTFMVDEKATGKTVISFSYSTEDTFNEKWENVSLNLSPIMLNFNSLAENESKIGKPAETLDNRNYKIVVETVLDEFGVKDINNADESTQNDVLTRVNDLLSQMNISEKEKPEKFSEIQKKYIEAEKEVFIEDVVNTIDGKDIEASINKALSKAGYSDFKDVPEEQVKNVLNDTVDELKRINPDIGVNTESLSQDEIVNVIEEISEVNKKDITEESIDMGLITVISVCVILIIVGLLIFLKKRKG